MIGTAMDVKIGVYQNVDTDGGVSEVGPKSVPLRIIVVEVAFDIGSDRPQ